MRLLRLFILVLLLLFCLGAAALFGIVGLGAWSAIGDQCPDGNDCGDATVMAIVGAVGALIGLVFAGFTARELRY